MEVHRSRGTLPLAVACVLGGVTVLALAGEGSVLRVLAALGAVVLGGVVLVGAVRPFRFLIGPAGIEVRRPGLRGTYRWEQFEALALDDAGRLVAVPAAGLGLRTTARHPRDGRAAVELLDLRQIRESPDDVAAALSRYSGGRFTDARTPVAARLAGAEIDFTVALRGYFTAQVDQLVHRAQDALAQGGPAERRAARAEIEQARAAGIPVGLRGYDVGQVDAALDALCAALTAEPTTDRETTT
ncbi:hypothetical protein ONA91_24935 [Micromonospora sp. DR5-3]|uniref:hypothetical protein n=1 Tax=unclassified Micromonospora TaxID=2617518 RepID=UPI0011DB499C|nr:MULTISPECIES: hypothetical protein [unclassified Micromonospora]MCW3817704.1 hypothetical protein [Micromonospora sp. DR5-3]TYC24978.1 hypothetical protein FXF52_06585 [Micromonospora sp. MP36]